MASIEELVGAALSLKVVPDASGFDVALRSKLTEAERAAEQSAQKIAGSTTRIARTGEQAAEKVTVAQLRAVAATERYNRVLQDEHHSVGQLASAQAAMVSATSRLSREQAIAARTAQDASKHTQAIGAGSVVGLLGASYAVLKIKDALVEGAHAAADLQRVNVQTENTLESTGNTAGVTAEHVDKLAASVSHYSGIQDTSVASAENLLLTFTAINDKTPDRTFDRATKAAVDMAVAFANARGGTADVAAQAKLLGLALNDPAHGLDRLRRSGVAFTAQQRDQIKSLTDAGKTVEAQSLILDLVEQKVGGSAQAFGNTAAGSAARAKVAYEEFTRSLATSFLPVATGVFHQVGSALDFLTEHKGLRDTALAVAGLSGALYTLVKVEKIMAALRQSELLSVAARLLGYRSLARAEVQLAAAEDRHAESATAVAVAETAAGRATAASGRAAVVGTGEQAAGRAGFLSRLLGRGAPAASAAGAAEAAGGIGLGGAALGALTVAGAVTAGVASYEGLSSLGSRRAARGLNNQIDSLIGELSASDVAGRSALMDRASNAQAGLATHGLGGPSSSSLAAARQAVDAMTAALGRNKTATDDARRSTDAHKDTVLAIRAAEIQAADATDKYARHTDQMVAQAQQAVANAQDLLDGIKANNADAVKVAEQMIGTGDTGLLDALPDTSKTTAGKDPTAAQNAATNAANATAAAQQKVADAQAKLNDLRNSGKRSAAQINAAERALADARLRAASAAERQTQAEAKATKAQKDAASSTQSTALSVDEVLKRATGQTQAAQQTAANARRLVKLGVSEPVLQQLLALDKTAPGTFANIAAHMTTKAAATLNHDQKMKDAARNTLEQAFAEDNLKSANDAAANAAKLQAKAYHDAWQATLHDPRFWSDILGSDLGKLLFAQSGVVPGQEKGAKPSQGPQGFSPIPGVTLSPKGATYNFNGPVTFQSPGDVAPTADKRRLTGVSVPQ